MTTPAVTQAAEDETPVCASAGLGSHVPQSTAPRALSPQVPKAVRAPTCQASISLETKVPAGKRPVFYLSPKQRQNLQSACRWQTNTKAINKVEMPVCKVNTGLGYELHLVLKLFF